MLEVGFDQQFGIGRGTSDIEFLSVTAVSADDNVEVLAGLGSDLHKKYRVATRPSKAELQLCVGAGGRVELTQKAVSWPTIELAAEDALEAICEGVRDLRPNRRIAILQPDHCGELGFESLVPGLVIDPQRRAVHVGRKLIAKQALLPRKDPEIGCRE